MLRMYWDNRELPSVEAPLGDFFASADEQQYEQLTSLAVCVNPRRGLNCYWDMPFYEGCRMTLENLAEEPVIVYYQIDYQLRELEEGHGYFHAQYRRTNPLPYKEDYTVLDGVKGKGQYVGTYMFWGVNNNGWWGEGEIKFFMDGDREYPPSAEQERRIISAGPMTLRWTGFTGRTVPHMQVCLRSPIRTVPTKPSRDSACTAGISQTRCILMRI